MKVISWFKCCCNLHFKCFFTHNFTNCEVELRSVLVLFFTSGGRCWIICRRITASEVDFSAPARTLNIDSVTVIGRWLRVQICRRRSCTKIICRSAGTSHTMGNWFQTVFLILNWHSTISYTLCLKKHLQHFWLLLGNQLSNVDNIWYEYSWHKLPSNDHSVSHFTQCMLLHYLGKADQAKYVFKINGELEKKHLQHYPL